EGNALFWVHELERWALESCSVTRTVPDHRHCLLTICEALKNAVAVDRTDAWLEVEQQVLCGLQLCAVGRAEFAAGDAQRRVDDLGLVVHRSHATRRLWRVKVVSPRREVFGDDLSVVHERRC